MADARSLVTVQPSQRQDVTEAGASSTERTQGVGWALLKAGAEAGAEAGASSTERTQGVGRGLVTRSRAPPPIHIAHVAAAALLA
jgi:hypothetical protein